MYLLVSLEMATPSEFAKQKKAPRAALENAGRALSRCALFPTYGGSLHFPRLHNLGSTVPMLSMITWQSFAHSCMHLCLISPSPLRTHFTATCGSFLPGPRLLPVTPS